MYLYLAGRSPSLVSSTTSASLFSRVNAGQFKRYVTCTCHTYTYVHILYLVYTVVHSLIFTYTHIYQYMHVCRHAGMQARIQDCHISNEHMRLKHGKYWRHAAEGGQNTSNLTLSGHNIGA